MISYVEQGLILLGAYGADGHELSLEELRATAERLGWRMAQRYSFASFDEMAANAAALPEQEEGYMLRFASGQRLKVKSPAYCRVHAIIGRVTPLGLWEAMYAGDDLTDFRRSIPEELWADFDVIVAALHAGLDSRIAAVAEVAAQVAGLSDKEVGLMRDSISPVIFSKLFLFRRNPDLLADPKAREKLYREVRQTGNILEGYVPTPALARVLNEA